MWLLNFILTHQHDVIIGDGNNAQNTLLKIIQNWQFIKHNFALRNAEKQFVAEDDEIQPGTEWERIAKLCDFNPKAKPGSKDVSRMRSMILQMKQNPVPIKNKA